MRIRGLLCTLSFFMLPLPASLAAETPAEFIALAFKAEEEAARKRSELDYKIGNRNTRYVIERVQPDRLHVVKRMANGDNGEIYVIDRQLFTKVEDGWRRSAAPPTLTGLPPALDQLKPYFAGLTEKMPQTIGGRRQRVFSGQTRWQAGPDWTEGLLEIWIDAQRRLPTRTSFAGSCSAVACSFTQTMTYDPGLVINAPTAIIRPNATQIYSAGANGKIAWRQHEDGLNGQGHLSAPIENTVDFSRFSAVTAAIGSTVVYAMEPNGDLWWFRHDGFRDGSPRWSKSAERIGNGWNSLDKIVAGENGVIYGRFPDGRLRWFRHLGYINGSNAWAPDRDVRQASDGWGRFTDIFAGSGGVLYGVEANGDLRWHKHEGHLAGENAWASEVPRVGNGWGNLKALMSPGQGIIYVVRPTGELVWYRHVGHAAGDSRFVGNLIIDTGWLQLRHSFATGSMD
jgi:hypothetical protein